MTQVEFTAVIEVLGKPQEHVENMLSSIITKLKDDERFELKKSEQHKCIQQENTELFATFAEVELSTKELDNMIGFCFDFMPSSIEIISPSTLELPSANLGQFLNDLQARLHHVDMVAKQLKMERDLISKNTAGLLKNYLLILLSNNKLSLSQLSKYTGVEEDKLADY